MLLNKEEIVAKLRRKIITLLIPTTIVLPLHSFTNRIVTQHAMEVSYRYIVIAVRMEIFFVVLTGNCATMATLRKVYVIDLARFFSSSIIQFP